MKTKGPGIDLKKDKKTVEQALRELKILMDEDIMTIRERRYYQSPSEVRRIKKKEKRANIRKYNKYNKR